ncbi:MAG: hemerythrin domain-containing protein, partial [Lacipirellulaceae bacterium]
CELFLQDHKDFTRKLNCLVEQLDQGSLAAAKRTAFELDVLAGPHVAFEEEVLYPVTGKAQGTPFQTRLLREHDQTQAGLVRLLSANEDELNDPGFVKAVADALRKGLEHAESCGTLVSHLGMLSKEEESKAAQRFKELKEEERRWTELPR